MNIKIKLIGASWPDGIRNSVVEARVASIVSDVYKTGNPQHWNVEGDWAVEPVEPIVEEAASKGLLDLLGGKPEVKITWN